VDAWTIPPVLLYAFGTVLVIMGGLRAYYLGFKGRPDVPEESTEPDPGEAAEPGPESDDEDGSSVRGEVRGRTRGGWSDGRVSTTYKRHVAMGLLWVGMGLFLIISLVIKR
jgi:hypothetical protein